MGGNFDAFNIYFLLSHTISSYLWVWVFDSILNMWCCDACAVLQLFRCVFAVGGFSRLPWLPSSHGRGDDLEVPDSADPVEETWKVTGRVSTGRVGNSLEQFPWVLNSFDTLFQISSRFFLVSFSCLNAFRFFLLNLVWGLHFWRFPSYQVNFTSLAVAVRLPKQTICTGRCTPKGTTLGSAQANALVEGKTYRILQSFSSIFPWGSCPPYQSLEAEGSEGNCKLYSRPIGQVQALQEAEKIRNA
jgi:hypothetical protein